jgi:anti-anti-sigma factor
VENLSVRLINHPLYSDVVKVHIKGVLYAGTLMPLEKAVQSVLSTSSQNKVIFDLADTLHVSSEAWSLFLEYLQRFRKFGGDVLLAGMNPDVLESFELLGFNKTFRFFSSADLAITQGFGKRPLPILSSDQHL